MTAGHLDLAPAASHAFKCQCAEVWAHPAARLLFGDAMHPGGGELTARLIDRSGLAPSDRALDVGSGTGATLERLRARGVQAIGVDYSATLAKLAAEHAAVTRGDAARLPFDTGAFDAVVAECVLSAIPDKEMAVSELRRVLRRDGRFVMSDVVVGGTLPDPLDSLLGWMACTAGALGSAGYRELVTAAGFEVLEVTEHRDAIAALVAKARRRVAMLQGAARVGIIPGPEAFVGTETAALLGSTFGDGDLDALAQHVLSQAAGAVEDGSLGYTALVARAH